jgi:hypothetical protein
MMIACHHPNFMPWPGLFFKGMQAEQLVLLDDVQFPLGGSWINRNRLKNDQGGQFGSEAGVSRVLIRLKSATTEIGRKSTCSALNMLANMLLTGTNTSDFSKKFAANRGRIF